MRTFEPMKPDTANWDCAPMSAGWLLNVAIKHGNGGGRSKL